MCQKLPTFAFGSAARACILFSGEGARNGLNFFNPFKEMNARDAFCALCKYEACMSDNKPGRVRTSKVLLQLKKLPLQTFSLVPFLQKGSRNKLLRHFLVELGNHWN